MYESPLKRRVRDAVDDAHDDEAFTQKLLDAIADNPDVRAAILRLTRARQAPPQAKTTTRTGRGR